MLNAIKKQICKKYIIFDVLETMILSGLDKPRKIVFLLYTGKHSNHLKSSTQFYRHQLAFHHLFHLITHTVYCTCDCNIIVKT